MGTLVGSGLQEGKWMFGVLLVILDWLCPWIYLSWLYFIWWSVWLCRYCFPDMCLLEYYFLVVVCLYFCGMSSTYVMLWLGLKGLCEPTVVQFVTPAVPTPLWNSQLFELCSFVMLCNFSFACPSPHLWPVLHLRLWGRALHDPMRRKGCDACCSRVTPFSWIPMICNHISGWVGAWTTGCGRCYIHAKTHIWCGQWLACQNTEAGSHSTPCWAPPFVETEVFCLCAVW